MDQDNNGEDNEMVKAAEFLGGLDMVYEKTSSFSSNGGTNSW